MVPIHAFFPVSPYLPPSPTPHAHSFLNTAQAKSGHPLFPAGLFIAVATCARPERGPAGRRLGRRACVSPPAGPRTAVLPTLPSRAAGVRPGPGACCPLTGKSSSTYGSYLILLKCWLCSKLWQKRFVFLCVCRVSTVWFFMTHG
ncbi:hypothetical protein QTO34_001238 [Cnephaeus nilssonii]|uniref:Uncharacterized protein n=1 Tax=Cnephaeus nilssonii TaxID=3371016 RepID=A0AA40LNF7_CNENI|nr:hypothetical protein QTO34_001238 [Eptesicus nilssonii]